MITVLFVFLFVIMAGITLQVFVPDVTYLDVVVTAVLGVLLLLADIIIKAVQALFGGGQQ